MLKIIKTEDGSESLFDQDLNETYHSTRGARSESEYVFIEQGLEDQKERGIQELRVLEVGMGTGLNAQLAWKWAEENRLRLHYQTLEPYPIDASVLNEMELMKEPMFQTIHGTDWEVVSELSEYFQLIKHQVTLEDFESKGTFDVIFFDAFGPAKQPDVWCRANIEKCFEALNLGGILTTYSAQGQLKRNLKEVGFELEVLPGALGKKEMTRGRRGENSAK